MSAIPIDALHVYKGSTEPSEFLKAALRYAAMAWPVFPCSGKEPLVKRGFHEATTDTDTIERWWTRWPNANIATPCGLKFFVLDVDVKEKRGDLTLEELERKHGRLPDTLQQITGSEVDGVRGRHYFFAMPDGLSIRSRTRVPGPGLDIRGQGGYIILEPSIHPTTKRKYIFDGADEIERQKILAAPEWLIKELVNTRHRRFKLPQELPEGCRNDQMFKAACVWRKSGMHQPEILAALRSINETRTASNPLPDAELISLSESCCRYEPKQIMPDTAYKLLREYEAQRAIPVQENPLYRDRYVKNSSGKPISCLANVVIALEQAPHWHASFAYDEFGLTCAP